jgi:hypothetical protein
MTSSEMYWVGFIFPMLIPCGQYTNITLRRIHRLIRAGNFYVLPIIYVNFVLINSLGCMVEPRIFFFSGVFFQNRILLLPLFPKGVYCYEKNSKNK